MIDKSRLGQNIKALRKAYGETQEKLGHYLNIEKNTVSYYENGKREPDKEMLSKIAKHYIVTVEELLFCDFTNLDSITIDPNAFLKNLDIILPIVTTNEAMNNKHFKKAYDYHKKAYSALYNLNMDGLDYFDICFDEYLNAYDDKNIRPESSANFLAIWNLHLMLLKITPLVLETRPAALMQLAEKDFETMAIINDNDSEFEKDAHELLNLCDAPEIVEFINKCKTLIKHSKLSDIIDYYIALEYLWNIVDNSLGFEFNRSVGTEMLNSFSSLGNKYATRFLIFSFDSISLTPPTTKESI